MVIRSLLLAGLAVMGLGTTAHPALAGSSPCPTLAANDPSHLNGACNLIITFNADGSIATTAGTGTNYDGSDDALIGVVNKTGKTISGFGISGSGIFGFDGDGVDTFIRIAANGRDTSFGGYGGKDGYFSNIVGSSDTVNFITPIAASGGTDYFSLENAITLSAPPIVTPPTGVPEPVSMALLGSGLLGLGLVRRRRS